MRPLGVRLRLPRLDARKGKLPALDLDLRGQGLEVPLLLARLRLRRRPRRERLSR